MKIIYVNCGVKNYLKEDHRSYIHNLCSCEKKEKKFQACTGFKPLTSARPVQRSTNQGSLSHRDSLPTLLFVNYKWKYNKR